MPSDYYIIRTIITLQVYIYIYKFPLSNVIYNLFIFFFLSLSLRIVLTAFLSRALYMSWHTRRVRIMLCKHGTSETNSSDRPSDYGPALVEQQVDIEIRRKHNKSNTETRDVPRAYTFRTSGCFFFFSS